MALPSPGASDEDRPALLQGLLADRFKLLAHIEERDQLVYELVMARADGQLGASIRRSPLDCEALRAAADAAGDSLRTAGRPAPPSQAAANSDCTIQTRYGGADGDRMEGDGTMSGLASDLSLNTGREVVDKTGLSGFFRFTLVFDRKAGLNPTVSAPAGAAPVIFTAVQEQLGLRLVAATTPRPTLIIERLERPTPN